MTPLRSAGLPRPSRSARNGVDGTGRRGPAVHPGDPLTVAAPAAVLLATALAAASVPARRAERIDPVSALRYE